MINKIKVGVLIDRLNVGGVEKIAIEEVRALRELGVDAYLVVLRRKGVINNAFLDLRKGLPAIFLDDRLPLFLKFSFKFPIFSFFSFFHITYPFLLPFVVKKNEFDYFIVHGTYTAFSAITMKKLRNIKFSVFVWDPIDYILKRVYSKNLSVFLELFIKIAKFLDKKIIDNSDVILVGGHAHDKYIKTISKKVIIKTISPSVHPLSKLNIKKKDYVLMVTAWKRGKNPEYVFDLVRQIPDIKIKMVGKWLDSSYKEEFKRMVIEENLSKNIETVGEVSEDVLSSYYSQALVLLQTNDDKGFGMPALEAAGHGTTFIIPQGQGVCDLFVNKEDGFYTKEKDTRQIINHLTFLMDHKKEANLMGRKAWIRVRNNYSWRRHAEELKLIINKN